MSYVEILEIEINLMMISFLYQMRYHLLYFIVYTCAFIYLYMSCRYKFSIFYSIGINFQENSVKLFRRKRLVDWSHSSIHLNLFVFSYTCRLHSSQA